MPGVRRFDDDAVLDRAAEAFWRLGYDATSIQDIEAATGLGRGSLYNAFGDKEALFLAVLARYGATDGAAAFAHLADQDVRRGLAATLAAVAARMVDPERPKGCLIINTCAGNLTPAVNAAIAAACAAMEAAIHTAMLRAHRDGQIHRSADLLALARFYTAIVQSLAVMSKAGVDAAALDDVVRIAMTAWPAPQE